MDRGRYSLLYISAFFPEVLDEQIIENFSFSLLLGRICFLSFVGLSPLFLKYIVAPQVRGYHPPSYQYFGTDMVC
jgi:hypothetical protein